MTKTYFRFRVLVCVMVVLLVVDTILAVFLLKTNGLNVEHKIDLPISVVDNEIGVVAIDQTWQETNLTVADRIITGDAREHLVRRYLEKYKSPLVPYSDLIVSLSDDFGFDYYWMVAIGQQESNLCKKIPEDSHNCWGYGIHKRGTLKFENYELALRSFAEYLKREYFDKGLNTPELMMKKYCPHSNGSWAFGVNQFIDDIEAGR